MTTVAETPVASYHSDRPGGRDGFVQLLHAEWTKLRTVRAWVIGLVVAALVLVLLSLFGADGDHASVCTGGGPGSSKPQTCGGEPPLPIGPGGEAVSDSYSFVHRPLAGDGALTVRVTSLTGIVAQGNVGISPNGTLHTASRNQVVPWAKAGLLLTNTTDQGSAYAAVMVTGSHGVRMQYNYTHDTAGTPGRVSAASPRWLRLVRAGDAITGYDSTDGTNWTSIGTVHLAGLKKTVQVGMFVTSPVSFSNGRNNGSPSSATARFDDAGLQGDFPTAAWTYRDTSGPVYPMLPFNPSKAYFHSGGTFTVTGSGDIAPAVAGGPFGGSPLTSIMIGSLAGLIALVVLGTVFATSEYRRGLIRTTLAASPRRGRVLAAKATVIGVAAFVVGLVATAVALPLARRILHANGNALLPASTLSDVGVIVGTAAVLALAAVIALALGTALRRSAGAVVTAMVIFIVPFILGTTLPAGAASWLLRLTPTAGFAVQGTLPRYSQVSDAYTLNNGYFPLSAWAGLGVLCIYAAVALGVAAWLLRRRDAVSLALEMENIRRAKTPRCGAGFTEAIHAEWTKQRTVAGPGWLLATIAVLTAGLSVAVVAATNYQPFGSEEDTTKLALSGVDLGQAVVAVLGVLIVSNEYSTGMIRITLAASPKRLHVLAAKVTVLTGGVLVAGTVGVLGSLLASRLLLPGNGFNTTHGYTLLSLAHDPTLRAAAGSVLYLALIGLLSLGLATVVRDTGTAIGIVLGLLYLFPIMASLVSDAHWHKHLEQIGPMTAGLSIQSTIDLHSLSISPWAGLGVLGLWAAGGLIAGGLVLLGRDA